MLLDLPSARDEGWRWSNLSALPDFASREPLGLVRPLRDLPWLEGYGDGPRLLFVDGRLVAEQSNPGAIDIGPVEAEPRDHALARLIGPEGWRLRMGRDHAPQGLVQIIHVSTGGADHLPAEVVLDVDAQAEILETYIGNGWTNRLSSFRLAKGARLMLNRRLLGDSGFVSLTDRAEVGEGASFVSATLAAGGADTRLDGDIRMVGKAAYAEAAAALLARGSQRHDANLAIRHWQPNGSSRQVWRSVADDLGICSVAARVDVARGAQKTDGEQSLKGIMLSRTATINAKPELEIFADDVKCAHGATVGELDKAALFYLESRGVPPEEARGLLTRAFVADALERIGDEEVRKAFYADVETWFANTPLPLAGGAGGGNG